MNRRLRTLRAALPALVAAVLLAAAALALTACGRAEFAAGTTPDVPAAVAEAGASIRDQGTAENYFPGGREAAWYVVSAGGSDEPAAVVSVLTFDSAAARDAAARDLDNARRKGARQEGVYTYGNAVVLVNRISDQATVRALDEALRAAGLK